MAILQFANNASSTLAQNITGVDTTIYLAAGTGSLFPTPTAGQNFYATIYNTSSTLWEIVLVTARSGDQLTVVRAQEGTTAQTWLVGDSLGMYPTAATMNKLIQNDQLQNGTYTVAQAGGTANALTVQLPSDLTAIPDGMTIVVKPILANTGAATLQVTIGSTVLPAIPIVKGYNLPLIADDIPSAGYPVQLIYSVIYNAWVMQMPSTLISPPVPPTYTVTYVIAAGGGGGGTNVGGGAGAGGVIQNTTTVLSGTTINLVIGAGGATGSNGNNSYITGVATATGGGAGGGTVRNGSSGGSGGGAGASDPVTSTFGGAGIPGQGYSGGNSSYPGAGAPAGGGGGASAAGANGGLGGGAGGAGATLTITGTTSYVGGGGGGSDSAGGTSGGGAGGVGGGGAGGRDYVAGANGTVNTGGGGGGGGGGIMPGGNGGSGVIYLLMPTARYTGIVTGLPTVTTVGSDTLLRFTNSGSYTA